jgi:hypothetical protein
MHFELPTPDTRYAETPMHTCELSFTLPVTSIGISEFAGSRILMPKDSGLTFSRSPMTMPPVLHYLLLWPTRLSRRDIAFRDSELQEFLPLKTPILRTPTPRDLLTRVLTDGRFWAIGISRIAISQFLLHNFGASTCESPIHDVTCRSDGSLWLGSTALPLLSFEPLPHLHCNLPAPP